MSDASFPVVAVPDPGETRPVECTHCEHRFIPAEEDWQDKPFCPACGEKSRWRVFGADAADPASIERLLELLASEWDDVHIRRRGSPTCEGDGDQYQVRNHTDEGLGCNTRKLAYGATLIEAVHHAIADNRNDPYNAAKVEP